MIDLKRDQAVWIFYQGYWRRVFFKWVSGHTCFFACDRKNQANLSAPREQCYTSARAALTAALSRLDPRSQIRFLADQVRASVRSTSPFPQNQLVCMLRSMGAQEGVVQDLLEQQLTGEDVLETMTASRLSGALL